MNKKAHHAGLTDYRTRVEQAETRTEQAETRTEQAKTRTEQAETRAEQAKTRTEQAETRAEQAETRTELAKTRTEQAETRSEQAEATPFRSLRNETDLSNEASLRLFNGAPSNTVADLKGSLEQLTSRQRKILQLIAEGHNTKQIASILNLSPKTIDYHRMKLMDGLSIHDIPGLVRFALRVGLVAQEN